MQHVPEIPDRPPETRLDEAVDGSPGPAYLTCRDVGRLLQLDPKTIARWAAHDPSMPALRVRGTLRFPATRLLAWLRAREQGRGRPRLAPPR
jgi:hypothetical protein